MSFVDTPLGAYLTGSEDATTVFGTRQGENGTEYFIHDGLGTRQVSARGYGVQKAGKKLGTGDVLLLSATQRMANAMDKLGIDAPFRAVAQKINDYRYGALPEGVAQEDISEDALELGQQRHGVAAKIGSAAPYALAAPLALAAGGSAVAWPVASALTAGALADEGEALVDGVLGGALAMPIGKTAVNMGMGALGKSVPKVSEGLLKPLEIASQRFRTAKQGLVPSFDMKTEDPY